jgi:hypothetical protein
MNTIRFTFTVAAITREAGVAHAVAQLRPWAVSSLETVPVAQPTDRGRRRVCEAQLGVHNSTATATRASVALPYVEVEYSDTPNDVMVSAAARSVRRACPPAIDQRIPARRVRFATTALHAA